MKKLKKTNVRAKKRFLSKQKLKEFSKIKDDLIFLDHARALLNDFSLIYSKAKVSHLTDAELVNIIMKKIVKIFSTSAI